MGGCAVGTYLSASDAKEPQASCLPVSGSSSTPTTRNLRPRKKEKGTRFQAVPSPKATTTTTTASHSHGHTVRQTCTVRSLPRRTTAPVPWPFCLPTYEYQPTGLSRCRVRILSPLGFDQYCWGSSFTKISHAWRYLYGQASGRRELSVHHHKKELPI